MQNDMELTFTFTVGEMKTIAAVLAEVPFKIAAPLLNKIEQQAAQQLKTEEDTSKK